MKIINQPKIIMWRFGRQLVECADEQKVKHVAKVAYVEAVELEGFDLR